MSANKPNFHPVSAQIQNWALRLPALAAGLMQELVLFIYSANCGGCSRSLDSGRPWAFCSACTKNIDFISQPYCPLCGIPYCTEDPTGHLCGDCLGSVHLFDRARSSAIHRGLLRDVIHSFKYGRQTSLARPLAQMLIAPGKKLTILNKTDLIIPVPLHMKRLRQRGFNQASLLARRLGSALKIPVDYSSLKRKRGTEPQAGLSRRQRAVNVKNAFDLSRPERIEGKSILLLDDVLTTGETANQCVRELKRSGGAKEVVVLTVARAVEW